MPHLAQRLGGAIGLAAALATAPAFASLGDPLVAASTGDIVVTFVGSDAGYDSSLSVNGGALFFPNHSTAPGTTFDLGSFAAGATIDIALHVISTGNVFHSGPGALNPDGIAHANVIYDYNGTPGLTYVGFEDTYGGGDRDYNDLNFTFTNLTVAPPVSPVPEPETYALMLAGLAVGTWLMRRRKAARI